MTNAHGPSLEQATTISETFARLSPEAQRVVALLSQLPSKLASGQVRSQVRDYLLVCGDAGLDPTGVERARAVLAAYEGVLGTESAEGIRRVA